MRGKDDVQINADCLAQVERSLQGGKESLITWKDVKALLLEEKSELQEIREHLGTMSEWMGEAHEELVKRSMDNLLITGMGAMLSVEMAGLILAMVPNPDPLVKVGGTVLIVIGAIGQAIFAWRAEKLGRRLHPEGGFHG